MSLATSLGWERPDQRSSRSAVTVNDSTTDPTIRQIAQRQAALGLAAEALREDIQRLTSSLASHPPSASAAPSLRIRELNAFRARTHEAGQGRREWIRHALVATMLGAAAAIGIVLFVSGGSSVTPAATIATTPPDGAQSVPIAAEAGVSSALAPVASAVTESDRPIAEPISALPLDTSTIEGNASDAAIVGEVQARLVAGDGASPMTAITSDAAVPLYGSGIDILSILVERGNTVGILARDYATTTDSIVILNNLADRDLIFAGHYLDVAPGYNPARDDAPASQ